MGAKMTLVEILQGANVALRLIQTRLLTLITLAFTFALYGWAMWLQTPLAFIICAVWGGSIFLPVLFAGRGAPTDGVQETTQHPAGDA